MERWNTEGKIERESRRVLEWHIEKKKEKHEDDRFRWFSYKVYKHLNKIKCKGQKNEGVESYASRVVRMARCYNKAR